MSRQRKRRGYTLVEISVVITVMAIAATLLGVMLAASLRTTQRLAQTYDAQRALARLEGKWRADVRAAAAAQATADGERLTLTTSDGETVLYQATSGGVARTFAGRREDYRLLAELRPVFAVGPGEPMAASLSFTSATSERSPRAPWLAVRLEAPLGSARKSPGEK